MPLKIFLSHAWRDKRSPVFKAIEADLRRSGYDVWVDKREIEYGEVITPRLDAAIAEVDVVLVLWSEHAHQSKAVRHEIGRAVELKKPLVPCKIDELEPGIYAPLRDRKYLRFDQNLPFGLLQLSQFLVRMVQQSHPKFRGHAGLQAQITAVNEALVEVEDSIYRRGIGASGNVASGTYIESMLTAGMKMIGTSATMPDAEKRAITHFMASVQDIARAHPDPKDDALKEQKMIAAISQADPEGRCALLQVFRDNLIESFATRRGFPLPTPVMPAPETSSPSPAANPLQDHIASIYQLPDAGVRLRQRLQELAPTATPAELVALEQNLREAIDAIPSLLEALAQAAQGAGVASLVAPLLQQTVQYFFGADDLVPDHQGLLGLLDDAYVVHGLLHQLNAAYQAETGRLLLPYDPSGPLQVMRAVLGPAVTHQLDQAIVGGVNQIQQQGYYQQLAQQRPDLGGAARRTGGPGSWGGCWEDEMARRAAELGFSFN
jgi:uncharacterized membrane protein YkvA (DUF1232 family)